MTSTPVRISPRTLIYTPTGAVSGVPCPPGKFRGTCFFILPPTYREPPALPTCPSPLGWSHPPAACSVLFRDVPRYKPGAPYLRCIVLLDVRGVPFPIDMRYAQLDAFGSPVRFPHHGGPSVSIGVDPCPLGYPSPLRAVPRFLYRILGTGPWSCTVCSLQVFCPMRRVLRLLEHFTSVCGGRGTNPNTQKRFHALFFCLPAEHARRPSTPGLYLLPGRCIAPDIRMKMFSFTETNQLPQACSLQ